MTENLDYAVELLTEKLMKVPVKVAPLRKIQCRPKYAPWVSDSTKEKFTERNAAQKKASVTKNNSDWEDYKKLRNSVNNILKSEKRSWQETKISNLGSDTSSIWKNLKNWLGWSKGGPLTKLISDGAIHTKP